MSLSNIPDIIKSLYGFAEKHHYKITNIISILSLIAVTQLPGTKGNMLQHKLKHFTLSFVSLAHIPFKPKSYKVFYMVQCIILSISVFVHAPDGHGIGEILSTLSTMLWSICLPIKNVLSPLSLCKNLFLLPFIITFLSNSNRVISPLFVGDSNVLPKNFKKSRTGYQNSTLSLLLTSIGIMVPMTYISSNHNIKFTWKGLIIMSIPTIVNRLTNLLKINLVDMDKYHAVE